MDELPRDLESLAVDRDGDVPCASSKLPSSFKRQATLVSLPSELLCTILSNVDPESLIDLAQTCQSLRLLIRPSRHDLLARLLRLELKYEYAGLVPVFDAGTLQPALSDPRWSRTKYACSGCLRLKSHMMFDNHSILKLKWRKPPPASFEVTKATDWINPSESDDSDEKGSRLRWSRQRKYESERVSRWKEKYKQAVKESDDRARVEAELALAGHSRTNRLCLECQFQRGHYDRPFNLANRSNSVGLSIVRSRQVSSRTSLDRYFPSLFPDPEPSAYPRLFKIYRERREEIYTLHVARCTICGLWKEVADFLRIKSHIRHAEDRSPPTVSNDCNVLCNQCLCRDSPKTLGLELQTVALGLAQSDLDGARYMFHFGWRLLDTQLRMSNYDKTGWLIKLQGLKSRLVNGLPWTEVPEYGGSQRTLLFDQCDRDDLRIRIYLFRDFCNGLSPADRAEALENEWFKIWLEDYEKLEAAWEMARDRLERIREDGFVQTLLAGIQQS